MALIEKLTHEELAVYEILRNPVLSAEFLDNYDKQEWEQPFELTIYQKEMVSDFNPYVNFCTGRAVGKTQAMKSIITWALVFNLYGGEKDNYLLFAVPSRVHLQPVWEALMRGFRSNSFLKNFVARNSGINSSEYSIKLLNGASLICRIAGQSGTGSNLVALHTPMIFVDECLTPNTKISGPTLSRRVKDLSKGDIIFSWNGETIQEDKVSLVRKIPLVENLLKIVTENKTIVVSETHKFFNGDLYIPAKELHEGDFLFTSEQLKLGKSKWTADEVKILEDCVKQGIPCYEIAKKLHRTERAIFRYINTHFGKVRNIFDSSILTEEQKQIVMGSLLGDGTLEAEPNRARFKTNHSLKQKEYVDWFYGKLKNICRRPPKISVNGGFGEYNYSFSTLGRVEFLSLYKELYPNNIKTVTREYLNKLSPQALAVWFMDDGTFGGELSTHGFSEKENYIIRDYFAEVWCVESSVVYDKRHGLFYIRFSRNGLKKFREIVRPFIVDSMLYKISSENKRNNTFSLDVVESCEASSTLVKEKIISITKERNRNIKYVYSIEVEGNHNYFANGLLVKNCGYFPWLAFQEMQPDLNVFVPGHRELTAGVPTGLRENNVLYHCDQVNSNYTKHRVSAFENPRLTEEDHVRAEEQYGGKDNPDYIHYHLGQHGTPVFALFDRNLMQIEQYPVYQLLLNGIEIGPNLNEYITKLSLFPSVGDKKTKTLLGIDLGYTEPSAIIIFTLDNYQRFRFHGRIRLEKVAYPIQEKIIDYLDNKFDPVLIGVDKGSAGISVIQHLQEGMEYIQKNYEKRLIPIDFSSWTVIGIDADGQEIKTKTKPFAVSVLQDYTNNHKIIYSSTDLEMVTELERMTYTKNPNGDIAYRTLTLKGGKKGEDHFTSAMLCASMAYYVQNEFIQQKAQKKQLYRPSWF